MMGLKQKVSDDLKAAMKAKDELRLSTLRLLSAAIANKEIELRKKELGLSDGEVLEVISSEAKRRRDAATEFQKGGREDLAKKEEAEFKMLAEYMPPEISDEELFRIINDGVREIDAKSAGDFGKVMKIIMPSLKGRASGDRIAKALRAKLEKI